MKVLLFLIIAVFGIHHFLKSDPAGASTSAKVDFPSWFQPEKWGPEARKLNLVQCRKVVADLDELIENPPTII